MDSGRFTIGDLVQVWWSMENPPAYFAGKVTDIGSRGLRVLYPDEGKDQWHDPTEWDILKDSVIVADSDSDDDAPLHQIVPCKGDKSK